MKIKLWFVFFILSFNYACSNKEVEPSLDKEIVGNWRTFSAYFKDNDYKYEDEKGINVNLGCYYLTSIQFKEDKTYFVNGWEDTLAGTWQIDSKRKMLILTCASNPDSLPYEFDVTITNNEFAWENGWIQIKHKKM